MFIHSLNEYFSLQIVKLQEIWTNGMHTVRGMFYMLLFALNQPVAIYQIVIFVKL